MKLSKTALILGLMISTPALAFSLKSKILTPDGIGQVKIGMSLKQAGKVLGRKIVLDGAYDYEENKCGTGQLASDLGFMYVEGKIATIYPWDEKEKKPAKMFKTAEGATIGTSEADLKKLYPQAEISNHEYNAGGHYFKIKNKNNKGYVFETDGSVVTQINIGAYPELDFTESCS